MGKKHLNKDFTYAVGGGGGAPFFGFFEKPTFFYKGFP